MKIPTYDVQSQTEISDFLDIYDLGDIKEDSNEELEKNLYEIFKGLPEEAKIVIIGGTDDINLSVSKALNIRKNYHKFVIDP